MRACTDRKQTRENHSKPGTLPGFFVSAHRIKSARKRLLSNGIQKRQNLTLAASAAQASRTVHPTMWSFTRPQACENAYTIVGPQNLNPSAFSAFDISFETAVAAGTSAIVSNWFCNGLKS